MSRVRDVDVRAGAVVVEVQGAGGADGQVGANIGKVVGPTMLESVLVWSGLVVVVPLRTCRRA